MLILGIIVGSIIEIILMSLVINRNVDELLEDNYNVELRAMAHFKKLKLIEEILNKSEKEKIPAVFVVNKIKEVINDRQNNQ